MMIANIALATICLANQCYPALFGQNTPVGVFPVKQYRINDPGYGGDVLVFGTDVTNRPLAIHRPWLGRPQERRLERLRSRDPRLRLNVTNGCINVMPDVYRALVRSGERQIRIVRN